MKICFRFWEETAGFKGEGGNAGEKKVVGSCCAAGAFVGAGRLRSGKGGNGAAANGVFAGNGGCVKTCLERKLLFLITASMIG